MDQRQEPLPSAPDPAPPAMDEAEFGAQIAATLHERADALNPDPGAAARFAARLDATYPARRRWQPRPRLVAAVAVALVTCMLVVATPVGRYAAAGVQGVTQVIVTTVRGIGTGGGDATAVTTGTGTRAAPSGASGSPVVAGTRSVGSPGANGTAANGSAIAPTPRDGSPGAQGTVAPRDPVGTPASPASAPPVTRPTGTNTDPTARPTLPSATATTAAPTNMPPAASASPQPTDAGSGMSRAPTPTAASPSRPAPPAGGGIATATP